MTKKALITGITGQDGSYLAELLLSKEYEVHGLIRRSSTFNTERIDHIYADPHDPKAKLFLHYGDITDSGQLTNLVYNIQPNEIYHLAAQSHVRVSFDMPEFTGDVTAIGTTRLLEGIRRSGIKTKFYQASSSEMFGDSPAPQNELTPFRPRSPYSVAKVYAYWMVRNYREGYGMFACNGILFNHESPRRGETFVTRKITRALARIKLGLQDKLYLGNVEAKRDWGYAPDFVEAMWLMLQQDSLDDYVIATGETHSVRQFIDLAFNHAGIELEWVGKGLEEKAIIASIDSKNYGVSSMETVPLDERAAYSLLHTAYLRGTSPPKVGEVLIQIDPRYFRPLEVESLQGDASKAKNKLN